MSLGLAKCSVLLGDAFPSRFRHPVGMTIAHRRSRGLALVAAIAGLLATTAGPVGAAVAPEFPAKDSRYHDYPEMVAAIQAVEAAHPSIVDLFSIGKSYAGRDLWAAKVSDNVATDENEPEVMFVAAHHADEHLSVEQALYLFKALANDYGSDSKVTTLVNTREIWIIFMLNPDGAQFDITGDPYRNWRKNRQPNSGSTHVGTDLNRNYGYKWGCCGGSSGNTASKTYRGPKAFSAPETQAMRDFVNSRVIGGRQQIRTQVSLHTNGQLVLYPYAYTTANVTGVMTSTDHNAFVALAKAMAAKNGYTVRQSGDWYISDGDEEDWLYATHRIFAFTVELYPPEGSTNLGGHHPPDEVIAAETARNRAALLYLIDVADCPYRATGTQVANCGLLYDDLEISGGWTRDPFGEDTATGGPWARGNPAGTSSHGSKQLANAASGSNAFITGLPAGSSVTSYDLDGQTSVVSRQVALPGSAASFGALTFKWYLAHSASSSSADAFRVYVVDVGTGTRTKVFEKLGKAADVDAAWHAASVSLGAFAGKTIRLLFVAGDNGTHNLVEAGFDDVRIQRPS
jgi:carboxypeptidase T